MSVLSWSLAEPAHRGNKEDNEAYMDTRAKVESETSPLEHILDAVKASADPNRVPALESFAREVLSRTPEEFSSGMSERQLVDFVTTLFDVLWETPSHEMAVRVRQLRESAHTGGVEIVIGDRPFVLDTVRQYLISKGFEIRHQLHPVVVVDRDESGAITGIRDWHSSGQRISLVYLEFEGHLDDEIVGALEGGLRECLEDLRLSTDDFQAMLDKNEELSEWLQTYRRWFPDRVSEIDEIISFLMWLRNGGFIFLGYREYDYSTDEQGRRVVGLVRGSGLGILRRERESLLWEPTPLDELPADVRARAVAGPLLLVSKANAESRVHRRARMDYVGIRKLDESGEIEGEHRFLGLFTWKAYSESPENIPILRRKLLTLLEDTNLPKGSHDYKAIVALFNDMPLEDLLLVEVEDLKNQISALISSEFKGDVRLVVTPDTLDRGVNVTVILPSRNYSDEVRGRLRSEISKTLGGNVLNDHLSLGEGDTARIHLYISASPERVRGVDLEALRTQVASIVRTWKQRLRDALKERYTSEEAHQLADQYIDKFSPEYVATMGVEIAVEDIERLEALAQTGLMQVVLEDYENGELAGSALRLFAKRGTMILADAMPVLENIGLRVIEADAVDVGLGTEGAATIHTFVVQGPDSQRLDAAEVGLRLTEVLRAVAAGRTDSDAFNRLVITAGLTWPQVAVLRSYSSYAFQIGAVPSRRAAPDALTAHPKVARILIEIFSAKFDPDLTDGRSAALKSANARFRDALSAVESIADDLTFRRLHNLIEATVRTSYFRNQAATPSVPRLTLKFDCPAIQHMPHPRPAREMYVYGPRTVGAHLRFGSVARGGIRWSERPDDFRTEVLGLVKTQQAKNAVIVPSGAKGAFVVRKPPAERERLKRAVRRCYCDFVSGLLDVTDNIVDGKVVHPPNTVIYDDEDPYLVVAADKGTAVFSDTANEIAAEYDFWMGDAFASGGSHGYDHKREGITARGTWECVRRHFREVDKDINAQPVTVVAVGDMSGDVFGNGMLLSRTIRLVAAFDHRDIFIDPNPDPEKSYEERRRLFELPGSSWKDYDASRISAGGGIYLRGAKEIKLSPEAQEALRLNEGVLNGQALIRAILAMPAELLWNGGIGTYVKSSVETNADVGDSTNDAVRIDADKLWVKVIGEGGNLGLTQLARIDYSLAGGRINADAVDNSAGVDMSDHEVNIKILLRALVDRGKLTMEERNALLAQVTDEVSEAVLQNNHSQSRALSLEILRSAEHLSEFRDAMYYLEQCVDLDRDLEFLPGWSRLQARQEGGKGLTRPELAVMLAYSKTHLEGAIIESPLPDDPALLQLLKDYFPQPIIALTSDEDLRNHRLQREIIATALTNRLINLMGSTFIPQVSRDTGVSPAGVARGWYVAAEIAGASEMLAEIRQVESKLPAEEEYRWLLALEGVLDRTVRWAIENLPDDAEIGGAIAEFKGPVSELCDILPSIMVGSQRRALDEFLEELKVGGSSDGVAQKLAALRFLDELMEVTRISHDVGVTVDEVGRVYFALADEVDFAWLIDLLTMAPGEDVWEQRAAQGLMQDLGQARRNLTLAVLSIGKQPSSVEKRVEMLRESETERLRAMRGILQELLQSGDINLAALTVATREILRQSHAVLADHPL